MTPETYDILLVEDTPTEARHIKRILRTQNDYQFNVVHCERLAAAFAELERTQFDLVLLDLHLPDSNELSGVQEIVTRWPSVPLIVLTNYDSESTGAAALREGAQDYLIKRHVDVRSLVRAIRYAVERQRTEEALRVSEERYSLAVEGAMDGIWDLDLGNRQMYCSQRGRAILGLPLERDILSLDDFLSEIREEDRENVTSALSNHLSGVTSSFEVECRVRHFTSGDQWVLIRGLAISQADRLVRMAGSITDVTRRKLAEEQLLHDAMHDALTGLPNRVLLMDRLRTALNRFLRDPSRLFAILFFDLDRFKNINDSLGHLVGDQLLVQIAARLDRFLRPGDTVARLGGDEFAILLNDLKNEQEATQVAERIHELLQEAVVVEGHTIYTSASIGIAICTRDYNRPEELLRDADLAMYRAKSMGNVPYAMFDTNMHERVLRQLRLETDLRRAVEAEEFLLHYQPIINMNDGRVSGFEALLRWRHPERGLVAPGEFVETAEETGLLVPIGWWVLERACNDLAQWQRLFPTTPRLTISVNISGKFFLIDDMPPKLAKIISDAGILPSDLRLEVTENVIMDHRDHALARLDTLRGMGVELHIDDFGTGYSSLTYLQRYQYDTLKIDRSFVSTMQEKSDSKAIVEAIVSLGNTLGMSVIAEGVEQPAQADRLRALNCPEAQGNLFAEPMPTGDVENYLSKGTQLSFPWWTNSSDKAASGKPN